MFEYRARWKVAKAENDDMRKELRVLRERNNRLKKTVEHNDKVFEGQLEANAASYHKNEVLIAKIQELSAENVRLGGVSDALREVAAKSVLQAVVIEELERLLDALGK